MNNLMPMIKRAISYRERVAMRSDTGVTSYEDLVASSGALAASLLNGADDLKEARIGFLVPPDERYVQTQ